MATAFLGAIVGGRHVNGTHKKPLLLLLPVLLLSGCNYERIKNLSGEVEVPKTWFAVVQAKVLGPKCVGCHNPQKPSADLDLTEYNAFANGAKIEKGNAEGSQLYQSVKTGRMPKGKGEKLTQEELGMLKAWIDAGASATAPPPEKPAPPVIIPPEELPVLAPNYKAIKKLIIDTRCLGCHSGKEPAGKLNLSSYKLMFANSGVVTPFEPLDSSFLQKLSAFEGLMPPPPRPPVTEAEQSTIKAWIEAGALNN